MCLLLVILFMDYFKVLKTQHSLKYITYNVVKMYLESWKRGWVEGLFALTVLLRSRTPCQQSSKGSQQVKKP